MNLSFWTKKKTLITLAIIATLATTTIILAQMNNTTQAAAINPHPRLVPTQLTAYDAAWLRVTQKEA
jgi:hypothetical protein